MDSTKYHRGILVMTTVTPVATAGETVMASALHSASLTSEACLAPASVTRSSGLEVGLQFDAQQGPNLDAFVDLGSTTEDSRMHDQFILA